MFEALRDAKCSLLPRQENSGIIIRQCGKSARLSSSGSEAVTPAFINSVMLSKLKNRVSGEKDRTTGRFCQPGLSLNASAFQFVIPASIQRFYALKLEHFNTDVNCITQDLVSQNIKVCRDTA